MGILSHPNPEYRGSRNSHRLMDEKVFLGNRELVPSEDRVLKVFMDEEVCEVMAPGGCRELVSRAARHMSLSPDYSIRCAFDSE